MKKWFKLMCSAFCFMSFAVPCDVLATSSEDLLDNHEDQFDRHTGQNDSGRDFNMTFVTGDFGLKMVSMEEGAPISTLVLFISSTENKIIKDAQVITTIIDWQGNQQSSRALPFKGGYMIAVSHLPIGQYRVEAEVATNGQLLTKEFVFNKTA